MTRASAAERRRLNEVFAELCAIPSPSGEEAAVGAHVTALLERAGYACSTDAHGNVFTRYAPPAGTDPAVAPDRRSVLLCAHLDTVPHGTTPIEPVLVDDGWENRHDAILGADNKAAVAVMLLAAERARNPAHPPAPVDLELLFTVREETALAGAKAFDVSQLRSPFGYVFDHATPIGEIVMASPTYYRLEAEFRGRAAHAGIRPEDGRSAIVAAARAIAAMRLGRLDDETTANIGWISGGSAGATNVVPDRCAILGETRSLDPAKAEAIVAEMVDHCHDAANEPLCECDLDVTVERLFDGYRHKPSSPAVLAAQRALHACGYTPRPIASGGGADANAFEVAGLHTVCLANGTERNHEPTERVSVAALDGMLDVTYALLDAVAEG
ncbi:MAG TPA: M20/M25/M40 family metallo-hydrolase [Baekduia sp.]|uniref:M20/M25/M40 family metallo-hydrolase n=1 Tax=Baekduia sp. TaxID=2600305 RepID=UPI002B6FC481|nr:M20/M25/M40 family metallo-hydrolase [Baekduia sp.]HMJ33800.1 M20/M25/M40 family metallo-hydrolase [Baekduia sp.]